MSQDWMDIYNGPQNIVCYNFSNTVKSSRKLRISISEIPAWATYTHNKKSSIILGSLDEQVAHDDILS